MEPVYVSRPAVALPPHRIPRQALLDDVTARHGDLPSTVAVVSRMYRSLPEHRNFSQPLDVVLAERCPVERNETASADILAMGLRAARAAIAEAGLTPADIDCLVTVHAVGDTLPGLDVHLHRALGLRPDIVCRSATEVGCAGGAYALTVAREHLAVRPDATVLVVATEALSSIHHHSDTTVQQMALKGLWGDGAAACLLSSTPRGPGLCIEETWEYLLPDSLDRYYKYLAADGTHFTSENRGLKAIPDSLPALLAHLAKNDRQLDFVVAHTGGAGILDALESGLGLGPDVLQHARAALNEQGNLGGPAVLAVLDRTYAAPPAHGAHGMLLGFGPGFRVVALHGTWWAPAEEDSGGR